MNNKNNLEQELINVKIVYEVSTDPTQNVTKILAINKHSSFEVFIELLHNLKIINVKKRYFFELVIKNGKILQVDKNNFDNVKKVLFSQTIVNEDSETYFIIKNDDKLTKNSIFNEHDDSEDYLALSVKPIMESLIISLVKARPTNIVKLI